MRALALFILMGCCASSVEAAEVRCGWLSNPTPRNWWLTDKDGDWTLSTQGSETQAESMELIPDMTQGEFVRTNGGYGYGCACLTVEVGRGQKRVTRILAARQLPLARCRADKGLPKLERRTPLRTCGAPARRVGRGVIGSRSTARAMNRTAGFFLLIQKGEAGAVVQLRVALDRPTFNKDGQALVTPAAATADTFEGAANALQTELDELRCRSVGCSSPPALVDPRATERPSGKARSVQDRSEQPLGGEHEARDGDGGAGACSVGGRGESRSRQGRKR